MRLPYDSDRLYRFYGANCITINNCKSFHSNKKSNLKNNKFLACGRLCSQKGFEKLIEAMYYFCKKNDDYILDIIGEGTLKDKLEKLINFYNLNDRVFLHPNTSNMQREYLQHDVFLMSSISEGFGLVTLEALECGLPVIGFDIAANKEIIKDNINGFLVPSYDTKAFAQKMLYVANNKESLKKIQCNIDKSIEKFEQENFINNWYDLIKKS